MKLKSISDAAQVSKVLNAVFDGLQFEPEFKDDRLTEIRITHVESGQVVCIAKSDSYSNNLTVMVEEPEGVVPNGYRLSGKYKNLIDVNEFFATEDDLIKKINGLLPEYDGIHCANEAPEKVAGLGLSVSRSAVINHGGKLYKTETPLLASLEV